MVEQDLKRHFQQLLKLVDGLHAIVVTDRDGVPILKVQDDHMPQVVVQQRLLTTAAMAIEQASKLGVANNKSIITMYRTHQVITLNKQPLIINMIADTDANTGMIQSLESDMNNALEDIRSALDWT